MATTMEYGDFDDSAENGSSLENSFYYSDIENLRKPWIKEPHFIPTIVVYGLAFLVGIVGNLLVVFAVLADRKSRNVTTTFLVSLAIADLLFLLVCVPYVTSRYFISHWSVGRAFCKVAGFVEMLSAVSSIINLTSVSVERYIVIVHPIQSRFLCTRGNTIKVLAFVWLLAIVASFPAAFVMDIEETLYHNNFTSVSVIFCGDVGIPEQDRLAFAIYQFIAMFAAPTIIMTFCYARVIYVLWISSKRLKEMTDPDGHGRLVPMNQPDYSYNRKVRSSVFRRMNKEHSIEIREARKQVIKMLMTVIVVFLLCWGPKLILRILLKKKHEYLYFNAVFVARIVFDCLPYIQSCLNPIIYGFMSRNIRKSMRIACQTYVKCPYTVTRIWKRDVYTGKELDSECRSNGTIPSSSSKTSHRSSKSSGYYEESTLQL
ncbi:allatostatin-A receptor-like [Liolophura sinensis]|uniref:allatostatin-A receptor-like n=1 Tax=Liolophura sinensis TaxID=3198878 RepID=UPI0031594A59